ncbi:hypothetical protein D9619_008135 [Psilocybe cf. subviscida]|uniref:Uncharacterized protein n=1 Tax=Psilocybe cf. subviscida TaxID=2480587 RepID=A0A8H5ATS3_9AGAR|nr:hypothetical protein D9619_008135 [Psilocybe cf. subviscida]
MDNSSHQHHMSQMDGQGGQIWPSSASGASAASSSSTTMSSPAMSQSPNSQLTMDLLQNFLSMQGLGDSIIQQQLGAGPQSPPTQARPHSPRNSAASSPNFSAPSNLLMEQQIKLSQLQQLQQLQNQIFQQQIALISGQSPVILPSPSILTALPLDASRQAARGTDASNKNTPTDSGMYLPTPGSYCSFFSLLQLYESWRIVHFFLLSDAGHGGGIWLSARIKYSG